MADPAYDWCYTTAAEPGLNGRTIKHPRGKLVGGSSAINSHSVVFPNHEWHDRIAEELLAPAGRADWSADGMRECYARWLLEGEEVDEERGLGSLDRVRTSYPRARDLLQSSWLKAFEEIGHATRTTGFVESAAGAVPVTNAVDSSKGERSHAGTAFLEPALERGNVTLRTGVKVDKIAFEDKSTADAELNATGVHYTHKGQEHFVRGQEIIICAGAFESPALLEWSGIGSKEVLAAANGSCETG